MTEYDFLIIGAGQAGIPLARRLAKEGRRVAIAERKQLGGSCVNFGCTPSKAVIASARVAHLARRAADFGIILPEPKIDFPIVLQRARKMVDASKSSLGKGLDECGAKVFRGHARFTGRDGNGFTLDVDGKAICANQVVINTGARTLRPRIEGLETVPYLHAGNWLDAETLPEHIAFAGAGYIALEMAHFYRRMGAKVTIIGNEKQIASHEDADIASALQSALEAEGITFHLGSQIKSVDGGRDLNLGFESGGTTKSISASHLFVATGREPNTDDLGLEHVGVKKDEQGFIEVNDYLATSTPGVWAAGDVRGGPMFTHTSWDDHRILESQLLGDGSHTIANRIVPYAIFTDPELGRVGMTEKQSRDRFGDRVKVKKFEMKNNGKAYEIGEPGGLIKLVTHADDGRLLGAAVLAIDGAELVSCYITLMNANAKLDAICRAIYIHPTLSEAVQSAAMATEM